MKIQILPQIPCSIDKVERLDLEIDTYNKRLVPSFELDKDRFGFFLVPEGLTDAVGGITGWSWMGSLHIHRLMVNMELRAMGYGKALLHAAETLAENRNCSFITVESLSFQKAAPFYLKNGYELVYEEKGFSSGMSILHLRKNLRSILA